MAEVQPPKVGERAERGHRQQRLAPMVAQRGISEQRQAPPLLDPSEPLALRPSYFPLLAPSDVKFE